MRVYFDSLNVFEHAIAAPAEAPPGTRNAYRNSDPLSLGKIIRDIVEADGEDYLTFPQRALFDKIGARSPVLETDARGNFILSGYDYLSARDWIRFGLRYLQDGVWLGERILPEGWTEFVRPRGLVVPHPFERSLLRRLEICARNTGGAILFLFSRYRGLKVRYSRGFCRIAVTASRPGARGRSGVRAILRYGAPFSIPACRPSPHPEVSQPRSSPGTSGRGSISSFSGRSSAGATKSPAPSCRIS